MSQTPILTLKNGSKWKFEWNAEYQRWVYHARKYTYGLFIDHVESQDYSDPTNIDVWIGMLDRQSDGRRCWCTVEQHIGAVELEVGRVVMKFKHAMEDTTNELG